MSAGEIKDKLSLPSLPTKISDVTVSQGVDLRRGVAAQVDIWDTQGGGIQYEIRNIDRIPT